LALAKIISLGLWWYLPSDGVELNVKKNYEPKYQRVDFTNMISKPKDKGASSNAAAETVSITNMILKGLYARDEMGYIIIALKSDPTKTSIVAIGEVYQGYTLKSIELLSVIFEKGGKDFVLELEKPANLPLLPTPQSDKVVSSEVSRTDIAFFAKDPAAIWKDISINEVKKADKIVGFKVTKINPKSKFATLGLMENDLIVKVNNVQLESYKDAIEVYKNIDKIDTIQIVVIRDNQEKELVYGIH
jgi:type II secretion system protein C